MKNKLPNIENLSHSELVQLESEVKKLLSEKKRVIEFRGRLVVSNSSYFTDSDSTIKRSTESLTDAIANYYNLSLDESVEIFDLKEVDTP
jgi:hypothetical protein